MTREGKRKKKKIREIKIVLATIILKPEKVNQQKRK